MEGKQIIKNIYEKYLLREDIESFQLKEEFFPKMEVDGLREFKVQKIIPHTFVQSERSYRDYLENLLPTISEEIKDQWKKMQRSGVILGEYLTLRDAFQYKKGAGKDYQELKTPKSYYSLDEV
jgi:hypothetical protein